MKFDAIRFCKDFNIPYITYGTSPKVTRGWIGLRCPNPGCKHNMDLDFGGFNLSGGYFFCWSCGSHSLQKIIKWYLNITTKEVEDLLWNYANSSIALLQPHKKNKTSNVTEVILPGGSLKKYHKKYLKNRGFDPDFLIEKYKLTAVDSTPENALDREYKNRIIIPIIDRYNRIISYQGRDVTGTDKIRYKGCKIEKSIMNYKYTLYGMSYANSKKCAIVEGVIDQWNMGDGFLATFGTAVTDFQIKEMCSFEQIFILFDPEPNAQESAKKIATKLAALNKQVEIIEIDSTLDPGELPSSEVKYIRRELGFV